MTSVQLLYTRIDGVTLTGTPVTNGLVDVTPAYRSDTGVGQMTTIASSFPVGSTIILAPGTYLFKLRASDGHGGRLKDEGVYRLVPASGTFQVDDLDEVTPTIGGLTQSDVAAMITAALTAGPTGTGAPAGTGTGGRYKVSDLTDVTTVGVGVGTAASQAAGRTALGAGTSNLVVGTTAGTAADAAALATSLALKADLASPALTGNPTAPTPTAGDNDTSIATTAFVTNAVTVAGGLALGTTAGTAADAATVVTLAGTQTITGAKTYSAQQSIPTATAGTSPLRKDQFDSYGVECKLYINYTTGVWPARVVPAGAPMVTWFSAGYANAVPPPTAVPGDFWAETQPG